MENTEINFSSPLTAKIILEFLSRALSRKLYNKTLILGKYTKNKNNITQSQANAVNADIIRWAKVNPEIISIRKYKVGSRYNSLRLININIHISKILNNINIINKKYNKQKEVISQEKTIYKDSIAICHKYLKRNKVLENMKYDGFTIDNVTENTSIHQVKHQYRYYYNGYSMQNIKREIRNQLINIDEEYGYFHEIDINSCFLQALNEFININKINVKYIDAVIQETGKSKSEVKAIINPVLFGHKLLASEKWILESNTFTNIQNKIETLRNLSINMNYCPLTFDLLYSNNDLSETKIKNKRTTQILQAYEYMIKKVMVKVILKNKFMIAYDLHDGIIIYSPYKRNVSKLVFDINKELMRNLDLKNFTVGLK